MNYRFREIRKHECAAVLDFAKAQGCTVEPAHLRHHLGLTVKSAGELIAVAMCVEYKPSHYKIEIAHGQSFVSTQLTDLADRCLRKVQSAGIASARLKSQTEEATRELFKQASWLDHIQETGQPDNRQPYIPETNGDQEPEPAFDVAADMMIESQTTSAAEEPADDPMAELAAQIASLTAAAAEPPPGQAPEEAPGTAPEAPAPADEANPGEGMSEAEIEAMMLAELGDQLVD